MERKGLWFGPPITRELLVDGEPQIWVGVTLHNFGPPADVTVRVTDIDPNVELLVPNCRLHVMGDDPQDEKYRNSITLKRDEPTAFDLVSMNPRAPGVPVERAFIATTSYQHSIVEFTTKKPWPVPVEYAIRTIDRPHYRMPVALDGSYQFLLTAHSHESTAGTYIVVANPANRSLAISKATDEGHPSSGW